MTKRVDKTTSTPKTTPTTTPRLSASTHQRTFTGPNLNRCTFCHQPLSAHNDGVCPEPLTLAAVRFELRKLGVVIANRNSANDYRVNLKDGAEATAYYTADLADALATGKRMHAEARTFTLEPSSQLPQTDDRLTRLWQSITDARADLAGTDQQAQPRAQARIARAREHHLYLAQILAAELLKESKTWTADKEHQLSVAVELCGTLAACLKEEHEANGELSVSATAPDHLNHADDGGEGCDYCERIIQADELQREVIGLEPRRLGECPQCDATRPADDDGTSCLLCGSELVMPDPREADPSKQYGGAQ